MPVRFLSFSNDSVLCADAVRSYTKNRLVRTLSPSINLFVGDYAASNRIEDLADQSEGIRRVAICRMDVDNLGQAFLAGFEQPDQTPSGAFVRSLFNLQDTRPLLRNIHYFTTNALHCQELFSRFLTFYRKPLWLPPLRTAYLGYHSRGRLSRTFFGSFRTFSLRSPAAHLPANSLFTLPHSPLLVNDFFPYFQLFSTLFNPCQNLGL